MAAVGGTNNSSSSGDSSHAGGNAAAGSSTASTSADDRRSGGSSAAEGDAAGLAGPGNRAGAAGGEGSADATAGPRGGTAGAAGGATPAGASGSASGASALGGTPGGVGAPSIQLGHERRGSAAQTRGANWANAEASRRASAITRPIKVIVGPQQLAVVGVEDANASDNSGIVSFNQPVDRVLDQLAAAIHKQVADWGIAGDGMYWRPTLVVDVQAGAQRQAERLAELLENSGVDVRLPQATARASEGGPDAAR
jgi:hypothetical protein